jgi:hypothetical protein
MLRRGVLPTRIEISDWRLQSLGFGGHRRGQTATGLGLGHRGLALEEGVLLDLETGGLDVAVECDIRNQAGRYSLG